MADFTPEILETRRQQNDIFKLPKQKIVKIELCQVNISQMIGIKTVENEQKHKQFKPSSTQLLMKTIMKINSNQRLGEIIHNTNI